MATQRTTKASTNGHHKRVIDYNTIAAAKGEVDKEPVLLKIGKEEIELPSELPAMISFLIAEGRVPDAVARLLGDKADVFWDTNPTMDQVNLFWDTVAEEYGIGDAGGIVGLGQVLGEFWDPLEADFQRLYQKDLRVEVETQGCRRLWVLVQGLPPEATVWRDMERETPPKSAVAAERPVVSKPDEIRSALAGLGLTGG